MLRPAQRSSPPFWGAFQGHPRRPGPTAFPSTCTPWMWPGGKARDTSRPCPVLSLRPAPQLRSAGGTGAGKGAEAGRRRSIPARCLAAAPHRREGRHRPLPFPRLRPPLEPPPLPRRATASLSQERRRSPLLEPGLGLPPVALELLREAIAPPVGQRRGAERERVGSRRHPSPACGGSALRPRQRDPDHPRGPAPAPTASQSRQRGAALLASDWRRPREGAGRRPADCAPPPRSPAAAGPFERGKRGRERRPFARARAHARRQGAGATPTVGDGRSRWSGRSGGGLSWAERGAFTWRFRLKHPALCLKLRSASSETPRLRETSLVCVSV